MSSTNLLIVPDSIPTVSLTRDVTKHLKRGHRWVFANCFDEKQKLKSGIYALQYKSELIGLGVVQGDTQLRFRMLCLSDEPYFRKNNFQKTLEIWAQHQWRHAVSLRRVFNHELTN